jgi:hypothetical protein
MKKSVYTYKGVGKYNVDIELLLDIGRELNDNDHLTIRFGIEKIIHGLLEESIKLNPEAKKNADDEKNGIISLFGDRAIYVEEIPNGYCNEYCCKHLPWFIVTTTKGRIKIGWRKRVIDINWADSRIQEHADTLFPDEDTTKYHRGIHAWGLDKAKEYINILLQ